jgi:uncharacterized protein YyaL (SSP411 family)
MDEYAFLAQALLALHQATGDIAWKERAIAVAAAMKARFMDERGGGFFFTPSDVKDVIVRQKVASDSPLPSGNAVAAQVCMELGDDQTAQHVLAVFAQSMEDQAEGMSSMVQAAMRFLAKREAFTVATQEQAGERIQSVDEAAKGAVEVRAARVSDAEVRVTLGIAEGYHINANPAGEGLIATGVTVSSPQTEVAFEAEYPAGRRRKYAYAEEEISVYEGEVVIVAKAMKPVPAKTPLRVTVAYQACTEEACLPAVRQVVELE